MPTSHVPSKKITVSAIHKLFPLDLTQAERCFSHAANFAERSNSFFPKSLTTRFPAELNGVRTLSIWKKSILLGETSSPSNL